MGLYDEIKCLYPLPINIPNLNERIFQTKSITDPCFRYFLISQDGLLVEVNDEKFKKQSYQIIVPTLFTGSIRFYSFYNEQTNEGWIEFLVSFKDGKLINDIEIIEVSNNEKNN